ncbi:protein translocase subunit SecDF [Rubritalea halochordaticola]|uniref:Multifunctional fusion protein n=1 Tax=Rubritalea halochordaticola TaxID=714537 RepID=A0ABP9V3P0_9BACT
MINSLAAGTGSDTTMVLFSGVSLLILLFWYLATDKEKVKRNVGTVIVTAITVLSLFAIISPKNLFLVATGEKTFKEANNLQAGIEIVGGTSFIIEVKENKVFNEETGQEETVEITPEAMDTAKTILENRLNESGTLDAPVTIQGNRIEIQIPKISTAEADRLKELLTTTAKLTLHKRHDQHNPFLAKQVFDKEEIVPGARAFPYTQKDEKTGEEFTTYVLVERRAALGGKDIARATPNYATNTEVQITLTSEGTTKMEDFTSSLKRGQDHIVSILDGEVMNDAVLNADILSKVFVISGLDNLEECERLAKALANPMENEIEVIDERSVSATLGEATVKQGINAGIAGLLITILFVILYYRYSGIIALVGLVMNIIVLFGAMALFGASFTLPGIAGIILTIGVAVDANVLIYERLREELAKGKSVRAAIAAAYDKAFSAIFDANITTLLTALILFWKATGSVKGFAVTLTIGILGTLIAALLCTRVLFWWSSDTGALKKVKFMNLIPERYIDFLGKRKIAFSLSIVLIVGGIGSLALKGKEDLGIDFVGGEITRFEVPEGTTVTQTEVDAILKDVKTEKNVSSQIETVTGQGSNIAIKSSREDSELIKQAIRANLPGFDEKVQIEDKNSGKMVEDFKIPSSTTSVSPTLGGEFLANAIWALAFGIFAVLIYITLRFEFSFAVGAFLALVHDILISLGILVIFKQELSLIHVGAFLTIAGYSINDTIVVFDRIREDLQTKRGEIRDVMNNAISATLSRTIITSMTTFMAVLVLFIFGGSSLKAFSLAIMLGVIVGTYSSIFIASPIVYIFSKMRGINLRRELLDANLEAEVNPAGRK